MLLDWLLNQKWMDRIFSWIERIIGVVPIPRNHLGLQ